MRNSFVTLCLFLMTALTFGQQNAPNSGDVPKNRLAISGWKDIKFNNSGNWKTVDVTTKGVRPNTNKDMAPAIQKMVNAAKGKTIFKFPAGNFKINSSLRFSKGDFQIIGSGKATKFLFKGGNNAPNMTVSGNRGKKFTLQNSIKRGDNKITLQSSSGLSVGDYLFIAQQNGGRNNDIDNQIVKILAKNGNQLTLDMRMGLDFLKSKARINKAELRKNIKFSNFYMERVSQPNNRTGQIALSWVQNAELSKIESKKVLISHLTFNNSRDVLVFQNNLYGNFGFKRSGGYNYGVTLNRCTRANVINNKMSDLRHHIALQFGSNHCVIAYNRTTIYNHYADYGQHNSKGCHNNLFEGNFGDELFDDNNKKAWGTPHTVWFRNHAMSKIGSEYPKVTKHAIIGNEIRAGKGGIKRGNGKGDFFIGANIININKENGKGKMEWGSLNKNSNIPPSLFLTKKPSYLKKWPLYGPDASSSPNPTPNAKPTVAFKTPSGNLTVKEGYAQLRVVANANDKDGSIDNAKLYIDNKLIRTENTAPFEWGHTDQPNELKGLKVGKYTFKVTVTDNKGATASDSFTLTVDKKNTDPKPNQKPIVSFKTPSGNLTLKEGYKKLQLLATASDNDGSIANANLYVDDKLIRTENTAPFEWGHADQSNELLGLKAGKYTIKVTVADNKGATATDTFVLTVQKNGTVDPKPDPSDNCKFGTPASSGITAKDKEVYNRAYVVGKGGPNLSNFRKFTINWSPRYNGVYQFAINTNNGKPDYYVDFKNSMSYQLRNARPEVTLKNTGFAGLDGSYWIAETADSMILVSKTKGYSIHFSNSGKKPSCSNKAQDELLTGKKAILEQNPFTNSLTLLNLADNANEVVLFDYNGKKVLQSRITKGSSLMTIPTSVLSPGVYFVKVLSNTGELAVLKAIKN